MSQREIADYAEMLADHCQVRGKSFFDKGGVGSLIKILGTGSSTLGMC